MSVVEPKGEVRTQGTHLYFVDRPAGGPPALVKMICPTGITGLVEGTADDIEDTCLDEEDEHTFVAGLSAATDVVVPFNLIPREMSHRRLLELKGTREELDWMALLSESADPPTLTGADGVLTGPATRSTIAFRGYVRNVAIDIASNEIVRGTLTIRRRGAPVPTWFTPAP